jgi:hypothetical protein
MASAYFDHDCAAEGQTDYYSKDEWKYFNKAPWYTMDYAETRSGFDWRFKTASDDVFAIKITATVKFGIYIWGQWGIVYTANPSIVISLANY